MMARTEVAVLYESLVVVRVPWDEKETLRRDGVIAIAVLQTDREHPVKRQQAEIERDFYTLVWDDTSCYLGGYDDNLYWHDFADARTSFEHRFPYLMPPDSITFAGAFIDPDQYAKAKAIFVDREGPMF